MKRGYEQSAEFKNRQSRFDFAEIAFTVLEIVIDAKKRLTAWWKGQRPKAAKIVQGWKQLALEYINATPKAPIAAQPHARPLA